MDGENCNKYHIFNLDDICDYKNSFNESKNSKGDFNDQCSRIEQDAGVLHDMVLYFIYKLTCDKKIFFVAFKNKIESRKFIKGLENALLMRYRKFPRIKQTTDKICLN